MIRWVNGSNGFGLAWSFSVLAWAVACGPQSEPSISGDAGADTDVYAGHAHDPTHGGAVVVLGEAAFHLEMFLDTERGGLRAYVFDALMENRQRIGSQAIETRLSLPGEGPSTLILEAVANPQTGETVGDTSEFYGAAPWLTGADRFQASIPRIDIAGLSFTGIAFSYPDEDASAPE